MNPGDQKSRSEAGEARRDFDILIVGAGFAGLYMLHRARQRGASVRLLEAGTGVGGTWYWNRYPGARVDVESFEYSYSFSEELQQEWQWTERYAAQPELLAYANHVADRFGLRQDTQFETRVASASFDESAQRWDLVTESGRHYRSRYCIMATGLLSAPSRPDFAGADSFRGAQYQTSRWPHEGVDFSGQRVALIGTGSSAIQCIPIIAQQAAQLTVFQRTASFSVPLRNRPMDPVRQQTVKGSYADLRRAEWESLAGFCLVHDRPADPPTQSAIEVDPAQRLREYESRWQSGGLCFYTAYTDLLFNTQSNETLGEFMRDKIRQRVRKPGVAEMLVPKNYPVLTKRLAADTGYFETFDRDNVSLVDVRQSPIEKITEEGVQVGGVVHAVDSIVYATGFDAQTGAMSRIDIRGRGGRSLKEHWSGGLRTFLGMMSVGFPNLFYVNGPGSPAALFNPILMAEYQGRWIDRCFDHLERQRLGCIEATPESEEAWVAHSNEVAAMTLFPQTRSWYMGDNIPGKPRVALMYLGGFAAYDQHCNEAAANGYQKFRLSASA